MIDSIDKVPDSITSQFEDLTDVESERLGKLIKEAAKCPIG